MKILSNKQDEFALYIIDRNLSESDYSAEKVRKIESNYSEKMSVDFLGFEGDYLLHKLLYENVDVMNKFFFLTANSGDSLRNIHEIQKHISFGKFSSDNFIDKTDGKQKEKLRNIINNHSQMQIQLDNSVYLEVLKKYLGNNACDEFMKLLINKNLQVPDALISCRKLLENILTSLAKKNKPKNPECWRWIKNKKELKLSTMITIITFDEPKRYNSNTIIELAMKQINKISSEFGAHPDLSNENILATRDTIQSLVYNLKDIILWIKKEHF